MFWSSHYAPLHLAALALSTALLLVAWYRPRAGRWLYLALFAWACAVNWRTVLDTPGVYLEYAELAVVPLYREFIRGSFSEHVALVVGTIATCQGLIAAGLFVGGRAAEAALAGATLFLVAIAPLGLGSGFPSTLLMAAGAVRLLFAPAALRHSLLASLHAKVLPGPPRASSSR